MRVILRFTPLSIAHLYMYVLVPLIFSILVLLGVLLFCLISLSFTPFIVSLFSGFGGGLQKRQVKTAGTKKFQVIFFSHEVSLGGGMAFWVSFFFIFIFLQRRHTFLYELGAFFYLSLLPSFFLMLHVFLLVFRSGKGVCENTGTCQILEIGHLDT